MIDVQPMGNISILVEINIEAENRLTVASFVVEITG